MKGKDEIKELFQKELGNYEAKVDPSLWSGIQSGLSGASATGGVATGMSITSKVIIGVVVGTIATVSSIAIFSNEEPKENNQTKVEKTENIQEPKETVLDDIVVKETSENSNNSEVNAKTEPKETSNSEEQNNSNNETQIAEVSEIETMDEAISREEETEFKNPINTSKETENNTEESEEEEVGLEKPLTADISINKQDNQYVKFNVNGENITRVEWYFGDGRSSSDFSPEHFYEEPGNFEVIAAIYGENNEIIEKTVKVNVEVEGRFTNLPNTFTPNNDGSNDEFFVEHEGIEEFQLNILNKRQELIFSTNDKHFRWRGYDLKGEKVPDGEYIYVIIAKDKAGNVINKYKRLTINP